MGAVLIEYRHGDTMYLFSADTILPMEIDDVDAIDYTFDLTFGTAYMNYLNSVPEYDLHGAQLDTLSNMLGMVGIYDHILTGHIDPIGSVEAGVYISYTIGMLQVFPYL